MNLMHMASSLAYGEAENFTAACSEIVFTLKQKFALYHNALG